MFQWRWLGARRDGLTNTDRQSDRQKQQVEQTTSRMVSCKYSLMVEVYTELGSVGAPSHAYCIFYTYLHMLTHELKHTIPTTYISAPIILSSDIKV